VALALSIPWSLAVEFAHLFTTDRITSMGDVGAQALGTIVGIVLWEAFGDELTAWLRQATSARSRTERLERALAAYVVLWAFVHLAPFDLTLDVGTLGGRFRRGAIQLVPMPFGGRDRALGPWLWDVVSTALAAVPVGAYAVLGRTRDLSRRHWLRAAELSAALLLLLEVAQVFIRSHRADVNDFLMGTLGAGFGIWLASRLSARPAPADSSPHAATSWGAVAALAGWCLVLAAYHWMPYDFGADPDIVRRKLARVSLVPFAGYRSGPDLNALNQLLLKTSLSLPLGLLAGFVRNGPEGHAPRLITAAWLVFAALVLGAIEAGQLFLPTRHPDPTDVLVGVAAAGAGLALARWIRRGI
jgi:VanZ family protein